VGGLAEPLAMDGGGLSSSSDWGFMSDSASRDRASSAFCEPLVARDRGIMSASSWFIAMSQLHSR